MHGNAQLRDQSTPVEEIPAIRDALKQAYTAILVGYPAFAAGSNLLGEAWETLFRKPLQNHKADSEEGRADQRDRLMEAQGFLMFLHYDLQRRLIEKEKKDENEDDENTMEVCLDEEVEEERKAAIDMQYDCIIFLGDLSRYGGSDNLALPSYERAAAFVPTYGRAYNQMAVILSKQNLSLEALSMFLMALLVKSPFRKAQDNLKTFLAQLVLQQQKGNVVVESLAEHFQIKRGGKRGRAGKGRSGADEEFPLKLYWMSLMLCDGLLDREQPPHPLLTGFLVALSQAIQSNSLDAFPAIHFINQSSNFLPRTKRFAEICWEPLLVEIASFCNEHVDLREDEVRLARSVLLPEDRPFIGLASFCDHLVDSDADEESIDFALLRQERIFRLAHQLQTADLLGCVEGRWLGGSAWQRASRQSRTMTLLAKQRLSEQVRVLEETVGPTHLADTPWLVPDPAYLISACEAVCEDLRSAQKRYLITLPVLAELDWHKLNNADARELIRVLSDAPHAVLRLQKPSEHVKKHPALPPHKPTMSPTERHQRQFLEALAWLAIHETDASFRILSRDETVLRVARKLFDKQ